MRKISYLIILCLALAGCGQPAAPAAEATPTPAETPKETPTPTPTPSPTATPTPTPEPTEEPTPEPTEEPEPTLPEGLYDAEIKNGEINTKEPVATVNNADITLNADPMVIHIDAFQISRANFFDAEGARVLQVPHNKDIALFTMYLTVENTSDEEVDFVPMPVIITNTKEQSEGSWTLSDEIQMTYHGQVIQHPFVAYNFDYTNPEDLTELELRFHPPINNATGEDIGGEITYTINLDDFEVFYGLRP